MLQGIMDFIGFGVADTAPPPVSSLSHVGDATSWDVATIVLPALQAGDIIVLFQGAAGSPLPASVTPTGFTNILNTNDGVLRIMADYKVAVAGDNGATITGMYGGFATDKMVSVFRPDVALTSVTPLSVASQITTGNPATQTVSSSNGPVPLIAVGCYMAANIIVTRTFSPAADAEVSSSTQGYLKYKIYNSSPANISVSSGQYGDNNALASFYLAVA